MTLVEVVIAIGIISIAIVPLIGILSVGLNSGNAANEDLALAAIVSYMQSDLRTRSCTTNAWTAGSNAAFDMLTNATFARTNFFDAQGSWVTNGALAGPNLARALYAVTVTDATNAGNGIDYSILVRWPHPSYGKTNRVPARLFRYE
jgi:uncharacterized protein (TIGR02598 family)